MKGKNNSITERNDPLPPWERDQITFNALSFLNLAIRLQISYSANFKQKISEIPGRTQLYALDTS